MDLDTFKVVRIYEIPADTNVLPRQFLWAIKINDGKIKYEVRFVIGVHDAKKEHFIVHRFQNIQPSTTRLILTIAAIHEFDMWTANIH